jgi:hypothetical protein
MSSQSVFAATTWLFRPIPVQSAPGVTIPILFCPDCMKHRVMTIKTIVPHLRTRDGVDVEFVCAPCGASKRTTVKPA